MATGADSLGAGLEELREGLGGDRAEADEEALAFVARGEGGGEGGEDARGEGRRPAIEVVVIEGGEEAAEEEEGVVGGAGVEARFGEGEAAAEVGFGAGSDDVFVLRGRSGARSVDRGEGGRGGARCGRGSGARRGAEPGSGVGRREGGAVAVEEVREIGEAGEEGAELVADRSGGCRGAELGEGAGDAMVEVEVEASGGEEALAGVDEVGLATVAFVVVEALAIAVGEAADGGATVADRRGVIEVEEEADAVEAIGGGVLGVEGTQVMGEGGEGVAVGAEVAITGGDGARRGDRGRRRWGARSEVGRGRGRVGGVGGGRRLAAGREWVVGGGAGGGVRRRDGVGWWRGGGRRFFAGRSRP